MYGCSHSDALPELKPWMPQDAKLKWKWAGLEKVEIIKNTYVILREQQSTTE